MQARDDPVERTTVTLPRRVARRLRLEAERSNRSISGVVREAVEAYLDGREAPGLPSFAAIGSSGRHDVSERAEELIVKGARRARAR